MSAQQRLEQLERERVQTRNHILELLDDDVLAVLRLHARPELTDQLELLLKRDDELSADIAYARYMLREGRLSPESRRTAGRHRNISNSAR